MSRFSRKLCNWTANWLDLPPNAILDIPQLTMIGNQRLIIENHRGIVYFSSELVRLSLRDGEIEVSGSAFVIRTIWAEEIQIEGTICYIKYNGTGEFP